ncbi:hypothetical protein IT414_02670 [bacterium]|nr:hypothetical protein [bacterium]
MARPESPSGEHLPFRSVGDKIGEGNFAEVHAFEHDPTKILKEVRSDVWQSETLQKARQERGFVLPETIQDIQTYTDFFKALAETGNRAGDLIPQTMFVLGHGRDGKPTTFMVQDRIEGSSLDQGGTYYDAHLTHEQKYDLCDIIDGLIDAYIKTYDGQRGSTVRFEKPDNFIYGRRVGSHEPHRLHYIDVVPLERFTPDRMILELNWGMVNYGIDDDSALQTRYAEIVQRINEIDELGRTAHRPQVA